MKRERNQVGACPCPVQPCDIVAQVFRFKARTEDTTRQRLANKFYLRCTAHGTLGALGERAIQDHILDKGDIWGAQHQRESPAASEEKPAAAPPPAPAASLQPKPATPPPRKLHDLDRFLWGPK